MAGADGPRHAVGTASLCLGDAVAATDAEALARSDELIRTPFDLTMAPMARITLTQLRPDRHLLTFVAHHLICDGTSLGIAMRELGALYAAESTGETNPLGQSAPSFLDRSNTDAAPADLAWWRGQLDGADPLDLPTDRPRAPGRGHGGDAVPIQLSVELSSSIRALARQSVVTPFVVILAAFQAVLHRFTGQPDITIGAPHAGRNRDNREVIGMYANMLPYRAMMDAGQTFQEHLANTRSEVRGVLAHQHVPFESLVQELSTAADLSRSPVFQAALVFQNFSVPLDTFPGVVLIPVEVPTLGTRYDLELELWDSNAISGRLIFAPDLYDIGTAEAIADGFRTFVEHAVHAPATPLSALRIMPPKARTTLEAWSTGGQADLPTGAVPDLVDAIAAAHPGAVALTDGFQDVSYGELIQRAEQFAQRLLRAGVSPGSRVALCAYRSIDVVIAQLGVLKAGAAYVPIDPAYPEDRIAFMFADADVALIAVQASLSGRFSQYGRPMLVLDAAAVDNDCSPPIGLPAVRPEDLMYVLYTSGTTGRPKGVMVEHRNVVRLVSSADYISLSGECVLLYCSLAFDVSTFEIWGPLANGGRVAIPPAHHLSAQELADWVRRLGVTTMWLTAGLFTQVADAGVDLSGVRQLLAGGDIVPPEQCRKILRANPEMRLFNGYGPTEATVFATSHQITATDLDSGSVPIGRPIGHTTTWVLDPAMNAVPVSAVGELYIGGDAVARGYLNQPDLTAERFVPDRFSGVPDARLYRTGDMVRWRPDGVLQFLGRMDRQVKVRGFRIELGEVEATLAGHPQVGEVTVLVREDRSGDKRLVAYVSSDGLLDTSDLRRHAATLMPEYMVPASIVVLDRLPLTANGKLDRKALPMPEYAPKASTIAARSPLETVLCGLFEQVLGVTGVGIEDDFFALGGHSLLATRLISAIRDALGVDVSIRAVFEAPTVETLALRVEATGLLEEAGSRRPALTATIARPSQVPLSFGQQRLHFLRQLEGPTPAYNIPVSIRLHGALDPDALESALGDVVARHEALRTVIGGTLELPCQIVLDVPDPQSLLTRKSVTEDSLAAHLDAAAHQLINLSTDLPVHAWLFAVRPDYHVVSLVLHHIAGDGWSMSILGRDLSIAYAARYGGTAPQWPELPVQYADFAIWQRSLLDTANGVVRTQLEHWTTALAGLPEYLTLPGATGSDAEPTYQGASVPLEISPDSSQRVAALADACGVTQFMVMQATVATLLMKLGAGADIPLGTPVAGRTETVLQDLVGLFTNTVVLRTDVSGDPTPRELLARIRRTDTAAFANQDVPFELLVQTLHPSRTSSRHPLFQVMLSYDNNAPASVSLPHIVAEAEELPLNATKFDLQFAFRQSGEGISGTLKYAVDHFTSGVAAAMAQQWRDVLEAVTADPDLPLSKLAGSVEPADDGQAALVPEPAQGEDVPYLEPRSAVERVIADTWAEVLGRDRVGVHDNFFGIGGHSLMAVRVSGRLRGRLETRVPVQMIFEHQTVAELAEAICASEDSAGQEPEPIPLLPRSDSPGQLLPASSGQQQLWFLDQLDPAGGTAYNLPAAFRIDGPLDVAALESAVAGVVERHEVLRTNFVSTETGELRTTPSQTGAPDLPVVHLDGAGRTAVDRLISAEGRRPFDLARDRLLRTRLLRTGRDVHVLLVTTHHIVADGWSLNVFTRELAALYASIVDKSAPILPALPVQFADFAAWQHEQLRDAGRDRQISYWREQLLGAPPSALPTDRPRPERMTFTGDTTVFEVEDDLVSGLERLAREEGATVFMVCLAAFCIALRSQSGQDDIVVGTPIAGRARPEVESLIGYFASTIALRNDLSGRPSFRELIRRVRRTSLDGFANQDVTFERVVEVLSPPRDPGRSPVYQVMFAYQNAPGAILRLSDDITLTRIRTARTSSILDLAFILSEDGRGGLQGSVEFNTALFDLSTMNRLVSQFMGLLPSILAQPDQPIDGSLV
ncbi:amino acid adenylation domain-containing protein [Streptomyces sp. SID13031]|nr:amino acid adenylation domain-containing protein [Streptomyces sp. SID13031]